MLARLRVLGTYNIRVRPLVKMLAVELATHEGRPETGCLVQRLSDGPRLVADPTAWRVRGIEWYALRWSATRPGKGDRVSIGVDADCPISEGDEILVIPRWS